MNYAIGSAVYWRTPFGDWFKGVVCEDRGATLLVDRIVPAFASGVVLEKFVNEYNVQDLRPAPLSAYH